MASKTSERTRPKYLMGHLRDGRLGIATKPLGFHCRRAYGLAKLGEPSHQKECGKGAGARVALKETKGDGFALGKAASIHEP
jgi:hypothetical protein